MLKKFFVVLVFILEANFNLNAQNQPNILWIYAEDTSPWMGCYGDLINANATPNIDFIAQQGVRFDKAFVPAPVCSVTRSALIVGQNPIRFGAHQHRSSRTVKTRINLPDNYKLLPELLKEIGYTTFNLGKGDYNFVWNKKETYTINLKSQTDFEQLKKMQPFFGQIQTKGGKNNTTNFAINRKVNPNVVKVPLDYPDNEIFRDVIAQHYDAIRKDDDLIGDILRALKQSGLNENTIVVYFSDHGANNLLRHKQMTTEGGLRVPFVLMGPKQYVPKGVVRSDLVNMLDLTATTLAWAGLEQPPWYEGKDLFAKDFEERKFVGGQKDRMDHTIDRVRTIRSKDFRYVKNYKLDRILLQPQYRDKMPYTKNIHQLYKSGNLSEKLAEIYFGERQPEELYEVSKDPEMIYNLARDPAYKKILNTHRKLLKKWLKKGDMGSLEENPESLKANGEEKKWGEGVNSEYESYRIDSDGDGLSDKWELLNGRDPQDGCLTFDFNNGGWQTEGWFSKDIKSNIAGFLGTLDFKLDSKKGRLLRRNLKYDTTAKDESIQIRLKSDTELKINIKANGKTLVQNKIKPSNQFQDLKMNLSNSIWNNTINNLDLQFEGEKGAFVTIDYIKLNRLN
ncbi:MAG: sulfatase-like hydrolase/transferase [Bacteroidota bacterium]|nr:sulfatase-like hydrolase/transferase [Bacteroidota bacterium]